MNFEPMYNIVHVDKKWFYADRDKRSYLLLEGEDAPQRSRKSKRFIPKTMFLAAQARPRIDSHRKAYWDGKIGIWSFTEEYVAQRSSANRPKGTICTRNIDTVDRDVYKKYLLTHVFPAIKSKWPRRYRHEIIFVRQDNAKPHVPVADPDIVAADTEGGWNIRLMFQPPNSPDMNVLDLGMFTSLQTIQYQSPIHGNKALITAVEEAFNELTREMADNIFLSLQSCMFCTMKSAGGNQYKLPHIRKAKLRKEGRLPESLGCDQDVYNEAIKFLVSSNSASVSFFGH